MRNNVNVGLFVSISSEHRRATFTCATRCLVADKDSWESFSHIIRRGAEREAGRQRGGSGRRERSCASVQAAGKKRDDRDELGRARMRTVAAAAAAAMMGDSTLGWEKEDEITRKHEEEW